MKQNTKLTKLIIARIFYWISILVAIFPFESIYPYVPMIHLLVINTRQCLREGKFLQPTGSGLNLTKKFDEHF